MSKDNGKSNGNGQGIKQQLRDEKMTLDSLVDVSVVSMFFVQKLGKASVDQVMERVQEIHADINEFLLAQSLEALRGRTPWARRSSMPSRSCAARASPAGNRASGS